MSKQPLYPGKGAPPQGPYTPGLRVGDFVFVSGQGPLDSTGKKIGETIEEQTAQVLNNVKAILEAGGATMADVVRSTVHLSDLSLFGRFNAVYETFFPEPRPTRTTVGSQLLMEILVEIDVIAYVGKEGQPTLL
jgi:2-iminobutanoate/2-iminopropanoate deaminase